MQHYGKNAVILEPQCKNKNKMVLNFIDYNYYTIFCI